MRPTGILLVLALVMAFSFAAPCGAFGGLTIDEPGTYTLSSDIVDSCVDIFADDVVLDCNGHTIECNEEFAGIYIPDSHENIEIRDCVVQDCYYGITASHLEGFSIHDNTFFNDSYGVFSSEKSLINGTISGNTFSGGEWNAIYATNVLNSNISDNEVYGNCWDWHWPGTGAIDLYYVRNSAIEGNEVYDNECTGIHVYFGGWLANRNVSILENTVYGNYGNGINLTWTANSSINDNEIYNNFGSGIVVYESGNITIDPNLVYGNAGHGIYLSYVFGSQVLDNEVYENCWLWNPCAGIYGDYFGGGSLVEGNKVHDNNPGEFSEHAGIWIGNLMYLTLRDNNVYNEGIGIVGSSGGTTEGLLIEDCRVHDNWYGGIHLYGPGIGTAVIGCEVHGNGLEIGADESSGLLARWQDEGIYVADSEFDNNFHGLVFNETYAYLEDVVVSNSQIHGIAMDDVMMQFWDLTLRDNWAAWGMMGANVMGQGLSIYGDTTFYLAQEDACMIVSDVWLGSDSRHGVWYEWDGGVEVCDTWLVDEDNIILRNTFVSLNTLDGVGPFVEPTTVTTKVSGCNGLSYYQLGGFPESQDEILEFGDTFSPAYESCAGTRATYSVPALETGYTATGNSEGGESEPEYACESDADCDECEYCSIANDACLPIDDCVPEGEEPECTSDSDCPVGYVCENEECVKEEVQPGEEEGPEPECLRDEDCMEGLVCVMQECVAPEPEPECLTDADCPTGMVCEDGECVEKEPEGPTQEDAEEALGEAQDAIDEAKSEGKDTSAAETLLAEAEIALADGKYEEAAELANSAKLAAQAAAAPPAEEEVVPISSEPLPEEAAPEPSADEGFPWVPVIVVLVILGLAWWFFFRGK